MYIYIYIKHSADIMVDVGDVFYTTMTGPRWAIQWLEAQGRCSHNCFPLKVAMGMGQNLVTPGEQKRIVGKFIPLKWYQTRY